MWKIKYVRNRDGKNLRDSTGITLSLKKLAQKICAKNASNRAKRQKIAQKRQKGLFLNHEKTKISTGGASAASIFFHLW